MAVSKYMEVVPFVGGYIADKLKITFKMKKNVETDRIHIELVDQDGIVVAESSDYIDVSYIPIGDTGTITLIMNIENVPYCIDVRPTKIMDLAPGEQEFNGSDLHWYLVVVTGQVANFVVELKTSGVRKTHVPIDVDGDGVGIIGILFRVSGTETVGVKLADGQYGAVYDLGTTVVEEDTVLKMMVLEQPRYTEYRYAAETKIKCVSYGRPSSAVLIPIGI